MWKSSKGELAKTDHSPTSFKQYDLLDKDLFTNQLKSCGKQKSEGSTIAIPDPNGDMKEFIIWKSTVANQALVDKYPNLQTYQGVSKETNAIRIRIENSDKGIQVMVLGGEDTWYIAPTKGKSETYLTYFKKDIPADAKTFWSEKILKENE